jgi:hypothetical protein
MRNLVVCFLVVCTIVACKNGANSSIIKKGRGKTITIENPALENADSIGNYIDTLAFIQLEFKNELPIGKIDKLIIKNDTLFILDKLTNSVFVYTKEGEIICRILAFGKGKGEYFRIDDFFVDEKKRLIGLKENFARKILYYTFNGKFAFDVKWKIFGNYITKIDSTTFVSQNSFSSLLSSENERYNVYFLNAKGEVMAKEFPFPKELTKRTRYIKVGNFWTSDSLLYYTPIYGQTIYRLYKDSVVPTYNINFNKYNWPVETYIEDPNDLPKKLTFKWVFDISRFLESSNTISFSYYFQKKIHHVLYCKKTGNYKVFSFNYQSKKVTEDDGLKLIAVSDKHMVYRDYFVASISPDYILKYCKSNKKLVHKFPALSQVTEISNPVLVLLKFKEF